MLESHLERLEKHRLLGSSIRYSDFGGLAWSLKFYISNKLQVMLILLVHGPHFEEQGTKSLLK